MTGYKMNNLLLVLFALQLLLGCVMSFRAGLGSQRTVGLTSSNFNNIRSGRSYFIQRNVNIQMTSELFNGGFDLSTIHTLPSSFMLSDGETGYSNLSLYFTLALYLFTLPGLFSLVTRSVKVKPVQKFYDIPGPANPTAKPLRQTAAEVMAYFKAMNYEANTSEETITFRGVMGKSKSQAAFLTFCTFMGLGSMGLILSILLPDLGANAYAITLLSPYAGIYYWKNAQRIDEVKVKMETSDDDQITSIIAQGGKEDIERFAKTLNLTPRGMVYVKGLFESDEAAPVETTM